MAFETTAIKLLDSQKEICSFGRMNMGSTRLEVRMDTKKIVRKSN
jgi:hypothetical protein